MNIITSILIFIGLSELVLGQRCRHTMTIPAVATCEQAYGNTIYKIVQNGQLRTVQESGRCTSWSEKELFNQRRCTYDCYLNGRYGSCGHTDHACTCSQQATPTYHDLMFKICNDLQYKLPTNPSMYLHFLRALKCYQWGFTY